MSIKDVRGKSKKPSAQSGRKNNNKSNFIVFLLLVKEKRQK